MHQERVINLIKAHYEGFTSELIYGGTLTELIELGQGRNETRLLSGEKMGIQ